MNAGFSRFLVTALVFFYYVSAQSQPSAADIYRVFFLGGQSNMEGFGYVKDLPPVLQNTFADVRIFHGNPTGDGDAKGGLGKWEALRPGHGTGFVSDGKVNIPSDRFGIELSFARRMKELYPNDKIAIIKYARNGSGLDSLAAGSFGAWEAAYKGKNGLTQFDYFLKTVSDATAVKDINGDGKADILIPAGILWMQGEGDASFSESIANEYFDNLTVLMQQIRRVFQREDLPIVIGKISDSGRHPSGIVFRYGDLIRHTQEKFAFTDKNAAIVRSTLKYDYSDAYHYDSAGYIDLGVQFADALQKLLDKK